MEVLGAFKISSENSAFFFFFFCHSVLEKNQFDIVILKKCMDFVKNGIGL